GVGWLSGRESRVKHDVNPCPSHGRAKVEPVGKHGEGAGADGKRRVGRRRIGPLFWGEFLIRLPRLLRLLENERRAGCVLIFDAQIGDGEQYLDKGAVVAVRSERVNLGEAFVAEDVGLKGG